NVLRKFSAQETFVRSVFEQTAHEVRHSGKQLTDRTIFANAVTHLDERAFHRTGHAVEQLKFETAAVDSELIGQRLCVRDAANVVRPKRGGADRFVLEQNSGDQVEIKVALRFLEKHRAVPSVLPRLYFCEIAIIAVDQ